ncbi:ABC transporter ATP-binding protein [Rhodococcus sp. X156]|uniref:ABC transporter ATP-binding protein n=1 Tax=Rhodococcus sp. X156 TaxID=2499145 RepID=UPI000FDB071F|nr:ABC transporter ATP-binding protein [Rhodococcus sp. X156]
MSAAPLVAREVSWETRGRLIVDGVSLAPAVGATVGLLGPNGSGKSTLLRMLAGLRRPTQGAVQVAGTDAARLPRRRLARQVAVVEQEVSSDQDLLVREVVSLGRVPHRPAWAAPSREDAAAVVRAADLTGVADRLDQRYATLSGGERQRVQIARALAQQPEVLLLDEPTNHLDVRHQLDLLALVRTTAVTTVVALHDLNLAAAYCDQVLVLDQGRAVAAGPPATVLTADLIAAVYGVAARVLSDELGTYVRYLGG